MAVVDMYMAYSIVRKLITPFNKMPAFQRGLIDAQGNFLKARKDFNSSDSSALGYVDVMVINLKKILAKIPGGASRLGTIAAAMYLLKSDPIKLKEGYYDESHDLVEELSNLEQAIINIMEDGAVAVNSTAGIAGLPPDKPPVSKKIQKQYTNANSVAAGKRKIKASFLFNPKRRGILGSGPWFESTTLEYHNELNPKIWNEDKQIKPEIRIKLLEIANAWKQFARISDVIVRGIVLTGGNANYNYTPYSDLDVHLIVDRNAIYNLERDLIDDYLQAKKTLWTINHPNISVAGYPVELYAQDVSEVPHFGQGVYDLANGVWVQQPEKMNLTFSNDPALVTKVDDFKALIDHVIISGGGQKEVNLIRQKISRMRGSAIQKGGEFSLENLVFKDLRNQGYLDKLNAYEQAITDREFSL